MSLSKESRETEKAWEEERKIENINIEVSDQVKRVWVAEGRNTRVRKLNIDIGLPTLEVKK